MFEDLNQITETNPAKRFFTVCASIALHFIAVLVVIIIPLVIFQKLPQSELLTFLVAPPPPPPAPVAPPPPPTNVRTAATKVTVVDPTKFLAPSAMPTVIPEASEEIQQFSAGNFVGGMPSGVSGGVAGAGVGGSGLTSGLITNTASSVAPPPPPPRKIREAYKIGGDLKESMLIKKVLPEYPPLATRMRLSDTVILVVTIDEEGNVSDIKVQKGNPILNEAAIKAVRQWKYSPTVLNGEPVPVIGTVKVIFSSKATQ